MEVRAQDPGPSWEPMSSLHDWALLRDVCKGVVGIHNFGSPLKDGWWACSDSYTGLDSVMAQSIR